MEYGRTYHPSLVNEGQKALNTEIFNMYGPTALNVVNERAYIAYTTYDPQHPQDQKLAILIETRTGTWRKKRPHESLWPWKRSAYRATSQQAVIRQAYGEGIEFYYTGKHTQNLMGEKIQLWVVGGQLELLLIEDSAGNWRIADPGQEAQAENDLL